MHRLASVGAATAAALVVAGVVGGATAAAAPAGGPVALYANAGGNGPSQRVVFVGAIGDHGTATNIDKNGKVDPNGNFVRVKLQKGTFKIDSTALNKTLNASKPQVSSHATCSAEFTGSGQVTFLKGTGLYKGISGTANVTVTFGGVGPRYKSGPKKGQCKPQDAMPAASYGFVTGQGTVSFAA
jgi:hypothetical protein